MKEDESDEQYFCNEDEDKEQEDYEFDDKSFAEIDED
jgi:hypothetical protein